MCWQYVTSSSFSFYLSLFIIILTFIFFFTVSGGQNPNYVTCTSSHTYIYACKDFGCSQCSVQTTLENNKCIVDDDGNVEYYSCVTK